MITKPSDADALIQNTMLKALVDGGYFAKAELLDVFAVHTNAANEALINWKNPGTFNPSITLVSGGAITFTNYAGFTGQRDWPKLAYIKTNFNPTINGTLISQNNISFIFGDGNNLDDAYSDNGAYDGTTYFGYRTRQANQSKLFCNSALNDGAACLNSAIYRAGSRGAAATWHVFQNLVSANTGQVSNALINAELAALGFNGNGTWDGCKRQRRFYFVFSYLTDIEVQDIIGIMNTYLTNYGTNLY
jgi:hypothetical protein